MGITVTAPADDPYTAPTVQTWRPVRPVVAAAGSPCAPPVTVTITPGTAPTVQVWRSESSDATPPACRPPARAERAPRAPSMGTWRIDAARRQQWTPVIQQIATTYRLEPRLLHAVISAESGYNSTARSPKNAQGLMQLIPATARRFGVNDPYNPIENLHGGARYLRWLLAFFQGDLRLALAGYNAGEGAVQRYGNAIPPYPETRTYVQRVLDFYNSYRSVTGL